MECIVNFKQFKEKYPIGTRCQYTQEAKDYLDRLFGIENCYLGPLEVVGHHNYRSEGKYFLEYLEAEYGRPLDYGLDLKFVDAKGEPRDPAPIHLLTNFAYD